VLLAVMALYQRRAGRQGLGMGDVKLLAAAALWVGPLGISWLVLAACASALATVLAIRLLGQPFDRTTRLPFGPHIALGLAAVLAIQALK
jgi:leader peptidase (prepilin peptidase)/N-methyltransferase